MGFAVKPNWLAPALCVQHVGFRLRLSAMQASSVVAALAALMGPASSCMLRVADLADIFIVFFNLLG